MIGSPRMDEGDDKSELAKLQDRADELTREIARLGRESDALESQLDRDRARAGDVAKALGLESPTQLDDESFMDTLTDRAAAAFGVTMFWPTLLVFALPVMLIAECVSGDGCESEPPFSAFVANGSVLESNVPSAPLAARCDVELHRSGGGCDALVTCEANEPTSPLFAGRVTCAVEERESSDGEDTSYYDVLVASTPAKTLVLDEGTGVLQLQTESGATVRVILHVMTRTGA